ncbi:MAG TPA: glycosyltransferase family 39 protein [Candidatus Saccharimonadales bacterium]|nr:glycosyltransferase family 39 protein [Candidatus Saccharimonadales bacterium]
MSELEQEEEFSFKRYFVPLTTLKAIHWIVIIGLIIFCNGLFNGFVGDDLPQITQNPTVQSFSNLPYFFLGSTFYNIGPQHLGGVYYKPLLDTFFSLIYLLFNGSAFPFHLFQILFYIVNVCLLFFVLKYFFKLQIAFILCLIFLVHPINSEVAFYISDMQDVLFFFFGIIAFWIVQRSQSRKALITASLCLFCSLLSKETGILFLITALLYVFMFHRKRFYLLLWYSLILGGVYSLLRVHAIGIFNSPSSSPIDILSLPQRIITIPEIFSFYIKTFLFPLNLSFFHQWAYKEITFDRFFLPMIVDLLFVVLLSIFALMLYKKHPIKFFKIYIFFLISFFAGIVLHLQIIPLDVTVAERWFYFPMIGLLGMMGILLEIVHIRLNNKLVFTSLALVVILLSIRTIIRSSDWRDEYTLVSHDIQVSKNDYSLENGLAGELIARGQFKEAKIHAKRSVDLFPTWSNYNNLGVIDMNLGEYKEAQGAFSNGLKISEYYLLYENLAALSLITGDPKKNIPFVEAIIKKYPYDGKLWLYLALLEYNSDNKKAAQIAINKAYFYDHSTEVQTNYYLIMNNQPLNFTFTRHK